jgi:hypothetical protein
MDACKHVGALERDTRTQAHHEHYHGGVETKPAAAESKIQLA